MVGDLPPKEAVPTICRVAFPAQRPVVLFRSGHAGVVAALPRRLIGVGAPSFSAALLPVSRSGHGHASSSATLGLVLPMLVLHCVRRIVIAITLGATDDSADRRTLCGPRNAAAIGAAWTTCRAYSPSPAWPKRCIDPPQWFEHALLRARQSRSKSLPSCRTGIS